MREPEDELNKLDSAGLLRSLRKVDSPQGPMVTLESGESLINFSSNDYLGLAASPELQAAFRRNIDEFGVGSGASRLVCGNLTPHTELETRLAKFKGTEAAIAFSSGFATAMGIIPALCGKDDIIILDKLCHASLIDGAKLSGATLRVFPHNDLSKLEQHLQWAEKKIETSGRILVITESVFSMDGDRAPLREIVELKNQYNALLLVDEAHAFGIMGKKGRGLAAELGVDKQVDFQMGTFSKALGLSGGYVCASREFISLFINKARSLIYSTAPSPALAATISNAIQLIAGENGDQLRDKLWRNIRLFSDEAESAIVPVVIGDNEDALQASENLRESGFLIPAIRYPTVPRGTARLRITFSAAHTEEQINALKAILP